MLRWAGTRPHFFSGISSVWKFNWRWNVLAVSGGQTSCFRMIHELDVENLARFLEERFEAESNPLTNESRCSWSAQRPLSNLHLSCHGKALPDWRFSAYTAQRQDRTPSTSNPGLTHETTGYEKESSASCEGAAPESRRSDSTRFEAISGYRVVRAKTRSGGHSPGGLR